MNYYDNEVMIIPANITIDAITDPLCGIYECPFKSKGQFSSRANGHPLYIAFKADGEIKTLYKVKSVLSLDFSDKKAIDDYDKEVEKGTQLYFPVRVPSGARGTEYRALKEIFNSPAKQDNGQIVLDLPPKNAGKATITKMSNNKQIKTNKK